MNNLNTRLKVERFRQLKVGKNNFDFQEKQAVWPPGSADTLCPRPPVMTLVQHFVSRMKKRQSYAITSICI